MAETKKISNDEPIFCEQIRNPRYIEGQSDDSEKWIKIKELNTLTEYEINYGEENTYTESKTAIVSNENESIKILFNEKNIQNQVDYSVVNYNTDINEQLLKESISSDWNGYNLTSEPETNIDNITLVDNYQYYNIDKDTKQPIGLEKYVLRTGNDVSVGDYIIYSYPYQNINSDLSITNNTRAKLFSVSNKISTSVRKTIPLTFETAAFLEIPNFKNRIDEFLNQYNDVNDTGLKDPISFSINIDNEWINNLKSNIEWRYNDFVSNNDDGENISWDDNSFWIQTMASLDIDTLKYSNNYGYGFEWKNTFIDYFDNVIDDSYIVPIPNNYEKRYFLNLIESQNNNDISLIQNNYIYALTTGYNIIIHEENEEDIYASLLINENSFTFYLGDSNGTTIRNIANWNRYYNNIENSEEVQDIFKIKIPVLVTADVTIEKIIPNAYVLQQISSNFRSLSGQDDDIAYFGYDIENNNILTSSNNKMPNLTISQTNQNNYTYEMYDEENQKYFNGFAVGFVKPSSINGNDIQIYTATNGLLSNPYPLTSNNIHVYNINDNINNLISIDTNNSLYTLENFSISQTSSDWYDIKNLKVIIDYDTQVKYQPYNVSEKNIINIFKYYDGNNKLLEKGDKDQPVYLKDGQFEIADKVITDLNLESIKTNILPDTSAGEEIYDIGAEDNQWDNIYAKYFNGVDIAALEQQVTNLEQMLDEIIISTEQPEENAEIWIEIEE